MRYMIIFMFLRVVTAILWFIQVSTGGDFYFIKKNFVWNMIFHVFLAVCLACVGYNYIYESYYIFGK